MGKLSNIAFETAIGAGLLSILAAGTFSAVDTHKSTKYHKQTTPKIQEFVKKYDINKNDILDLEEGISMSKYLGFNQVLPSEEAAFMIYPHTFDWKSKELTLKIFCPTGETKFRDDDSDGYGYNYIDPAWKIYHKFPLSKLE